MRQDHPPAAKLILKDLQGLVVIDEFQRQPELLELIRVLASPSIDTGTLISTIS